MTIVAFKELHLNLKIVQQKQREFNPLPSDTDPTQDIPVRKIELAANGAPINVKQLQGVYSNLKPENFTALEKRHQDKFDVLGDYQKEVSKVAQKGVTTNFKNPKKQKQNEEQKDN